MNHVPSRTPNLIWRIVENNLVIVSATQGKVSVLNPVGAIIWENIDGENSVQKIATALQKRFESRSASELEGDLSLFLDELTQKGLILWEPN